MSVNEDRHEVERQLGEVASDDSASRLEDKIYYEELLERLPMKVILNNLSDYDKTLIRLIVLEGFLIAEAAQVLCNSPEKVAQDWNRLRAKLRGRARSVVEGTYLDNPFRRRKGRSKRARAKKSTTGSATKKEPQPDQENGTRP